MRPTILAAAFASLLLLAMTSTRAADEPSIPDPIDGFQGIAIRLPKNLWPDKVKGWTKIQEKAATDWAVKNLMNERVKLSGTPSDVTPTKGGGAEISIGNRQVKTLTRDVVGHCEAQFPKSAVPELEKARKGDDVTFVGTIRFIELRDDAADDSTRSFKIIIGLEGSHVVPSPKRK